MYHYALFFLFFRIWACDPYECSDLHIELAPLAEIYSILYIFWNRIRQILTCDGDKFALVCISVPHKRLETPYVFIYLSISLPSQN